MFRLVYNIVILMRYKHHMYNILICLIYIVDFLASSILTKIVRVCEVFGCLVREGQGLQLFCFPKNQEQYLAWLDYIKINRPKWNLKTNSRVCEVIV